ncbi:MAG: Fe-Mn family superoxide dismutase [Variovorax sp.]
MTFKDDLPATMEPPMKFALEANFGSFEQWRAEFTAAMIRAFGRGSGSVLLSFQPGDGRLVNQWAADRTRASAGSVPLLALDVDEHAHLPDHGAAHASHIRALMHDVEWRSVYERYQAAVDAATESIGATAEAMSGATAIDVRRAGAFQQAASMLPEARWLDPMKVTQWAGELPNDQPFIVYCVHGHEVSRTTALRMRAAGLDARFLRGGIDGWQSEGGPVVARPEAGGRDA